jgi:protein tyrosine phosphatase (PTP) superfamily phosphohydrolase (DUF442 family)
MIKNRTFLTIAFSAVLYKNGIRVMTTSAANPKVMDEIRTSITRKSPWPGLNSPKKLWWAKQVTEDYFVAGRLSRRQLQYASEGGFKSVISLFTYKNNKGCCIGNEYLPSTTEMTAHAKEVGLQFRTVLDISNDSSSGDSAIRLEQSLKNIPKPALVFSDRGYSATYALFMHLLKNSTETKDFTLEKTVALSELLEMDFSMKCTNQNLCTVAGEKLSFPKLNTSPKHWLKYWPAIPVYKNWFVAGQILESHIPLIQKAGFKSVVNLRAGTTHKGKPSQETVNLLNIKDCNKIYVDEYAGNELNSSQQFVNLNPEEFGDTVGYNEEMERRAFRKEGFPYYHLPVGRYLCNGRSIENKYLSYLHNRSK